MKTKTVVLLAMALGCGLVAMLGVQQILSGGVKPKDVVQVLVAKQDIGPGKKLEPPEVGFQEMPREAVPQGAVTDAEQFDNRSLKVRAFAGDIIMLSKLGEKGEHGIAGLIPKGMRVATVPVNMTSSNSGMIRPGDRIDVLVTYSIRRPGQAELSRTKTVLEYIEVFAVDRNREGEGSDANKGTKAENLSVLVTPEQSHVLMLANSKGKLQLALRNGQDKDLVDVGAVDDKIFDELKPPPGMFIEEEIKKPVETKKVEVAFIPEPETVMTTVPRTVERTEEVWAIEIFEGDKKRVETIKIPISRGAGTVKAQDDQAPAEAPVPSPDQPPVETPAATAA